MLYSWSTTFGTSLVIQDHCKKYMYFMKPSSLQYLAYAIHISFISMCLKYKMG